jgi:hypothetical protein
MSRLTKQDFEIAFESIRLELERSDLSWIERKRFIQPFDSLAEKVLKNFVFKSDEKQFSSKQKKTSKGVSDLVRRMNNILR